MSASVHEQKEGVGWVWADDWASYAACTAKGACSSLWSRHRACLKHAQRLSASLQLLLDPSWIMPSDPTAPVPADQMLRTPACVVATRLQQAGCGLVRLSELALHENALIRIPAAALSRFLMGWWSS